MRSMGILDVGFLGGFAVAAGFFVAGYFSLKRLLIHLEKQQPGTFHELGRPEMSGPPAWVTEPVAVRKFLMSKAYEKMQDPTLTDLCATTKKYFLGSIIGFIVFLSFGFAIFQAAKDAT